MMRKILWLDFILAISTGLAGLLGLNFFSGLFALDAGFIHLISIVHCLYGAFGLANLFRKKLSFFLIKLLIGANFLWACFSVFLVFMHYNQANKLGVFILILQVVVVGGLAIVERRELAKLVVDE